MDNDPTIGTPSGGTQTTPTAPAAAPAAGRAAGTGKRAAAGPKMADHVELAKTIRTHLQGLPASQRDAALDAWATVLLNPKHLAAVLAMDKLGAVNQTRWDQDVAFARIALD